MRSALYVDCSWLKFSFTLASVKEKKNYFKEDAKLLTEDRKKTEFSKLAALNTP